MKNCECIICRQASESVYSLPIGRVYYREPAYAGFKNMLYSEAHRIHLQHVEYREFNICDKCAAEEYKRLYRLRPFKVTSAPDLYLTLIVLLLALPE